MAKSIRSYGDRAKQAAERRYRDGLRNGVYGLGFWGAVGYLIRAGILTLAAVRKEME